MEDKRWVDFKVVKAAVTMRMLLEHYGAVNWKVGKGDELRGPCVLPGCNGKRSFSWNPLKNAFQCFDCKARGNVLDLVAKREDCSVKDAAAKLAAWFKVGEGEQSVEPAAETFHEQLAPGIYVDKDGKLYEVVIYPAIASDLELMAVYRELFGDYRYWVASLEAFLPCEAGEQVQFQLVKKL
jgi:hypothetical protein